MAGGALGTFLRYSVAGFGHRVFDWTFPIGTLIANLVGSFVIGLLWGIFEVYEISPNIRTFIFVGILGGFTTFSSFMLETLNLYRDGEIRLALLNILVSNVAGILLVISGFTLSKVLIHYLK